MRENKNITNTTKQSQISVLQAFTQSIQENMRNKNKVKDLTNDREESFRQLHSFEENNEKNIND
jgi:undecaprenyl pyrophosphate synthase